MAIPMKGVRKIEAILFDMNGTLRRREPNSPTRDAAINRMMGLLKLKDPPDDFWEELALRYKSYGLWAQENLLQLTEKEIWTRWLLPDVPPQQIEPIAAELSLAWSERKGRTVPIPDAEDTLHKLKQRGYKLGVISNSMSTLDIPHYLELFGWEDYFEAVILSSAVKCRKPAPEIFWEATRVLKLIPAQCAYIGNRISRDLVGCKRAGFAVGIIIETEGKRRADEQDQLIQPDLIIHSLAELLMVFPTRVLLGQKAKRLS
jgi:putative hydrolase of the HAD superfamily